MEKKTWLGCCKRRSN